MRQQRGRGRVIGSPVSRDEALHGEEVRYGRTLLIG